MRTGKVSFQDCSGLMQSKRDILWSNLRIKKRLKDLKQILIKMMNALSCETFFINIASKCKPKCILCEAHCLDVSSDMDFQDIYRVVEESKAFVDADGSLLPCAFLKPCAFEKKYVFKEYFG